MADYYQLKVEDMKSKTQPSHCLPQTDCHASVQGTDGLSLPKIGELFGGRDHTTVIHACDKIARDMESDLQVKRTINELIKKSTKTNRGCG